MFWWWLLRVQSKDAAVRRRAVDELGRCGDPRAGYRLAQALQDPVDEIRRVSTLALGRLCDVRAVDPLVWSIEDANEDVATGAVRALGWIGAPAAVEPLAAVAARRAFLRPGIAYSLGEIAVPEAIAPLRILARDSFVTTRRGASWALRMIGTPESQAASEGLRHDADRLVRYWTQAPPSAFAPWPPPGPERRERVEEEMTREREALGALSKLRGSDDSARMSGAEALAVSSDPRALSALYDAADGSSPAVRSAAVHALAIRGLPL